jgi:hypothetical protein
VHLLDVELPLLEVTLPGGIALTEIGHILLITSNPGIEDFVCTVIFLFPGTGLATQLGDTLTDSLHGIVTQCLVHCLLHVTQRSKESVYFFLTVTVDTSNTSFAFKTSLTC